MDRQLRHRLIGATALTGLAAVGSIAFGTIGPRPDFSVVETTAKAIAADEKDAQQVCRFDSKADVQTCVSVEEYIARVKADKAERASQAKTRKSEAPVVQEAAPTTTIVKPTVRASYVPQPRADNPYANYTPPAHPNDGKTAFSFKPLDTLTPDKSGARYFITGGKTYKVTPDVYKAFQESGLPINGLLATAARESGLNPRAVNPDSGACGLFQFMTNKTGTLYEAVYNYGAKNGYGQYVALVDREVTKNGRVFYSPVNAQAKATLTELCKDAAFNTRMHAEYTEPKVRDYEEFLGNRKITTGEFILMNNIGVGGLKKFFMQAMQDKKTGNNTTAWDAFKGQGFNMDKFKANRSLLYNDAGKLLTVRESYARVFAEHGGGWGELRAQQADRTLSSAPMISMK